MRGNVSGGKKADQYWAKIGAKIAEYSMQYFTATLAVVLCIALAFYVSDGYYRIGEDKFLAYRNIMVAGSLVLSAAGIMYLLFTMKIMLSERRRLQIHVSLTDGFVLAYLILSGVSVVSGGFYQDVLWGFPGWNMGIMSQIGFALLYFFLSRFGRYYRIIFTIMCIVSCGVYIMGILNRLQIDPLGFYDGLTDMQRIWFLSTLGQSSWYGSFLAVTLPIGLTVFLYESSMMLRAAGGFMMILGFGTLVTQNSDSAYFAMAGVFIVFFMASSQEYALLCRFMTMLAVFFASGKVMCRLMRINPNPVFKPDYVTELMWTSMLTWVLLIICLTVAAGMYVTAFRDSRAPNPTALRDGSCPYPAALMRRLRRGIPLAAVIAAAIAVCMVILQARGSLPGMIAEKLADISYFNWGSQWGNGRGRIWSFSAKMFMEADVIHKLFGVGPDGFHSYVAARYSELQELYWGSQQLTNAHNEWLTSLINAGIVGTIAYMGIYVTAIRRCLHTYWGSHNRNHMLIGIAAACVSYMLYNFFCYQQVLCTPFVFMLMGAGEYIRRQTVDETQSNG